MLTENWKKEPVCRNVVIFGRQSRNLSSIYRQIKSHFFINKAAIVTQFSREEAIDILFEIQNEKVFIILEKLGKDLELYSWAANNKTSQITIDAHAIVNSNVIQTGAINLSGRHLIIGTVHNPPAVRIDPGLTPEMKKTIGGIEPSLIETMANHLQFTYDYVEASPKEMWGEVYGHRGNLTITGLLGMLARKEVDVAVSNFYINNIRWPYVSYTVVYKFSYESFLVPAPKPYAKWKAVFYSFTLPTWLATIASAIVVIMMLRLVAVVSSFQSDSQLRRYNVFADYPFCCLYVIGNLLNVQVQPQSILSTANRMFLIWWLFGTLILTTGYRSGLISYMTFPFTPPAIDTLQQLVDSPLKKASFSVYTIEALVNASSEIDRTLGAELIPHYNLTGMFVSLESGEWAVESNLDNLLYTAATMYPTTTTGPKVHLIKDKILPSRVAFGLQKDSQLKVYFDKKIQHLIEAGIVDHLKSVFAKKMDKWNPKKANSLISFSLDSLQGAFYLLVFGFALSTFIFVAEIVVKMLKRPQV
ncbi:uncharacterized protein LOC132087760 [Daphnia carinata]|uniref:uncharacterized protein LOC132087760 n=1 Tax=Daphnia carinata TaxID=120202 RepID=UPI0028697A01|nr:uncharacterized protein LOC132087760 [Daphnia carinata]